jgi:hypothetical protein
MKPSPGWDEVLRLQLSAKLFSLRPMKSGSPSGSQFGEDFLFRPKLNPGKALRKGNDALTGQRNG